MYEVMLVTSAIVGVASIEFWIGRQLKVLPNVILGLVGVFLATFLELGVMRFVAVMVISAIVSIIIIVALKLWPLEDAQEVSN